MSRARRVVGGGRAPRPAPNLLLVLVLLLPLAGCFPSFTRENPVKQRFKFDAERAMDDTRIARAGTLRVGRVRVARAFERVGFVYQTADASFETDFWNEFFSPPGVLFREEIGQWLGRTNIFAQIVGSADFVSEDWLLEARIHRIFGDVRDPSRPTAVLDVQITILDARGSGFQDAFDERYVVEQEVGVASARALSDGWNRALEQVLIRFEADVIANEKIPAPKPR